jgi:hypothetical protein
LVTIHEARNNKVLKEIQVCEQRYNQLPSPGHGSGVGDKFLPCFIEMKRSTTVNKVIP